MKALIFDFDGLMVDTEMPVYESWQALYRDHGHELALETYVQCVGSTVQQFDPLTALQDLLGDSVILDREETTRIQHAGVRERSFSRNTLPGVRELIAEAQQSGLGLAVASSSPTDWIEPWLERLALREAFDVVRTRDDVSEAKPSPELFLSAAQAIGVHPNEALVLEDSLNGLRAAQAAGMRCVVVPNAVTDGLDFSAATLVLKSLADLSLTKLLAKVRSS